MDARELSARLPPPRDDEPSSLRQDIVDELADHLRCALRRDLLATGDAEGARRRVIDKFGDPGEIARQLWFQAMRSKIMSQRLMLGAIVLLTAVCLALVGLTGWLVQRQRMAAVEQQRVLAETMERLARAVESTSEAAKASAIPAPAVSSIQVKLTLGASDGPPATGYSVHLQQLGFGQQHSTSENSNSEGVADFGYCEPGRYEATIHTPWGFNNIKRFVLHPSAAHVEHVVCPPAHEEAQVSFVATLPEDLRQQGVQALVQLNPGTLTQGDESGEKALHRTEQFFCGMMVGKSAVCPMMVWYRSLLSISGP